MMGLLDSLLLLAVLALIGTSGFFSGAETAVTSANRIWLRRQAEEKDARASLTMKMLARMDYLLSTTLVGTNLSNTAATTFASVLIYRLSGLGDDTVSLITTLIMTPVILVLGEMVPKALCRSRATPISITIAPLLKFSERLFMPAVYCTRRMARLAARMAGLSRPSALVDHRVTREDFHDVAELAQEQGLVSLASGTMFQAVFELHALPVSSIMVPLASVAGLPTTASVRELETLAEQTGFTRFPVYGETIESIVGIVNLRTVLVEAYNNPELGPEIPIKRFIQTDIPLVNAEQPIGELVHKLHYRNPPIAIVVDDVGKALGWVTAEDLVEQLVGDLRDERDSASDS